MRDITLSIARNSSDLVWVMLWAKDDQGHLHEVGYVQETSFRSYELQAFNPMGEQTFEGRAGPQGLQSAIGWAVQWASGLCEVPA